MVRRKSEDGRVDGIDGIGIEYFCTVCLQLRLSFRSDNVRCGNCECMNIIKGEIGTLDKQALLKHFAPIEN